MQQQLFAFLRLARVYFSLMPILPYLIGVGLARRAGFDVDWALAAWGLAMQILVQVSISFLNDYWDVETDALNQNRTLLSGGSGALTTGVLPRRVGIITGCTLQGAALGVAVLVGIGTLGWAVLLLAMFAAHAYTMPPFKLVYRGLGEIAAALVAALLVPAWGYSLQADSLSLALLGVALPLLPFLVGMMLGIAAPDYDADRQVGKHTLVVLLGREHLARLYAGLAMLGYALTLLILPGFLGMVAALGVFLNLPLVVWAWWGLRNPVKQTTWGWFWMVARTGLPPGVVVVVLAAAVWGGEWI